MKYKHGIGINPIRTIWRDEICSLTNSEEAKKRGEIGEQLKRILESHLEIFEETKAKLYAPKGKNITIEVFTPISS